MLIDYQLRRVRSPRVKIAVHPGGQIIVTAPKRVSKAKIDQLVHERHGWIKEQQEKFVDLKDRLLFRFNPAEYKQYKKEALAYVTDCLKFYNQHYRIGFGGLSIRNPRTRWGSCSSANNLSFNYKIVLLPSKLAEYIVVHELCHYHHLDHSDAFWNEVDKVMPDYYERKEWLRKNGAAMDL